MSFSSDGGSEMDSKENWNKITAAFYSIRKSYHLFLNKRGTFSRSDMTTWAMPPASPLLPLCGLAVSMQGS